MCNNSAASCPVNSNIHEQLSPQAGPADAKQHLLTGARTPAHLSLRKLSQGGSVTPDPCSFFCLFVFNVSCCFWANICVRVSMHGRLLAFCKRKPWIPSWHKFRQCGGNSTFRQSTKGRNGLSLDSTHPVQSFPNVQGWAGMQLIGWDRINLVWVCPDNTEMFLQWLGRAKAPRAFVGSHWAGAGGRHSQDR